MFECQRAVTGMPFGKVARCFVGEDVTLEYVHSHRPGEVAQREGQLPVTISLIQRRIHSLHLSALSHSLLPRVAQVCITQTDEQ